MAHSTTDRGFAIYDEFTDTYGTHVSVTESSSAEGPRCWIFADKPPHLDIEQAKRVRDALDTFIRENPDEMTDICGYGQLPAEDPRSLACDYAGLYQTHRCENVGTWTEETQQALDAAGSVAELRTIWGRLEKQGEVDTAGGAEYHHALAHLRLRSQLRSDSDRNPSEGQHDSG